MSFVGKLLKGINCPEDLKGLKIDELDTLAIEIRRFLLNSISKTGGHLASNLGVVELTIALHRVFDSPKDKFVWDVGHQAYVHKMITGRTDNFDTLRKYKGLSGFPKRCESEHDIFETGHSSTSISAGLGIACANKLMGVDDSVVSIIGDGALTGGMAFEALNHAGHTDANFIVILNDNEMSISENVGGLSKHLNNLRTDPKYYKVKDDVENVLNKIPAIGKSVAMTAKKAKDTLRYILVPGVLFEELGFTYIGPVDGHDIKELVSVLNNAKSMKGPILIHVMTKKGKGYHYAQKHPDKFHGISPFDINSGKKLNTSKDATYSNVFGDHLCKLAEEHDDVVAITAAMPSGTGLGNFRKIYKDRFFDVGIAEQHGVTFAAGLAEAGYRPYFAVYSTFLQRGYDQVIHDVCLQNLPVTLCLDRAGIVGQDGETHHGILDISYLNSVPNIKILAPRNGDEFESMLTYAHDSNGPIAIRYPRGKVSKYHTEDAHIDIEEIEILSRGKDIGIVAVGKMVDIALDANKVLKENGINATIINPRIIKPLDINSIVKALDGIDTIFTMEDNVRSGGFGVMMLDRLNMIGENKNICILAFPDDFIEHGETDAIFNAYGMDAEGIVNSISDYLNK